MRPLTHGSKTYYQVYGCRCPECVTYQRERVARNRAERLASGRLTHGTRSAYDAGCRCENCRSARRRAREQEAEYRHQHRLWQARQNLRKGAA